MIIEGTVHHDNISVPFLVDGTSGTFTQWGHPDRVLGRYVDLMERLRDALIEHVSEFLAEEGSGAVDSGS